MCWKIAGPQAYLIEKDVHMSLFKKQEMTILLSYTELESRICFNKLEI